VHRRGLSAAGGMSGWRSQKVVLPVSLSEWRPQTLKVLRASTLCCADNKVSLNAGHQRRFCAAHQRVSFFMYV
jgi:hypothetical protein